jgi:hypothetical protein
MKKMNNIFDLIFENKIINRLLDNLAIIYLAFASLILIVGIVKFTILAIAAVATVPLWYFAIDLIVIGGIVATAIQSYKRKENKS